MKLRNQFLLAACILGVLLLVTTAGAVATRLRVESLREQQRISAAIERQANNLSYLSNNYLLYQEQLQLEQWDSTYVSLESEVDRLEVNSPSQLALVEGIKSKSERLEAVFREVAATVQAGTASPANDPAFLQVSWSRMEIQNRQIITDVSRLDRLLDEQVDRMNRVSTLVIFSLIAAFGVLLLASYGFMYRRTIAGLSDLQRGAEMVGRGNLDYRMMENRRDEIGEVARAFDRMTSDLQGLTASKKDLEREMADRKLAEEEKDALFRRLQQALIDVPEELAGVRFGHLFRSATEAVQVGGDFYDVFEAKGGRIGLLMGDVSGHGVEAARTAMLVKDTVHAFAHQFRRPHVVLRDANRLLVEKGHRGFVTAFLAFLEPETGKLAYSSAGHPPPLMVVDGQVTRLELYASPLGVSLESRYTDSEADMRPGNILVFYTDGITEARNGNSFYGEDGLNSAVQELGARPAEDLPLLLLERVLSFSGGRLQDDAALLAVTYVGQPIATEGSPQGT